MINREFTHLFGFTSEEAVNKNINDLVVPDDLKEEAIKIDNLASLNQKEVRQTIRRINMVPIFMLLLSQLL